MSKIDVISGQTEKGCNYRKSSIQIPVEEILN